MAIIEPVSTTTKLPEGIVVIAALHDDLVIDVRYPVNHPDYPGSIQRWRLLPQVVLQFFTPDNRARIEAACREALANQASKLTCLVKRKAEDLNEEAKRLECLRQLAGSALWPGESATWTAENGTGE